MAVFYSWHLNTNGEEFLQAFSKPRRDPALSGYDVDAHVHTVIISVHYWVLIRINPRPSCDFCHQNAGWNEASWKILEETDQCAHSGGWFWGEGHRHRGIQAAGQPVPCGAVLQGDVSRERPGEGGVQPGDRRSAVLALRHCGHQESVAVQRRAELRGESGHELDPAARGHRGEPGAGAAGQRGGKAVRHLHRWDESTLIMLHWQIFSGGSLKSRSFAEEYSNIVSLRYYGALWWVTIIIVSARPGCPDYRLIAIFPRYYCAL